MLKGIRRGVVCGLLGASAGCGGWSEAARDPQQALCPELAGNVDPIGLSFSDDSAANGRIGAFVSASRGLYDAAVEMESLATDACLAIRRDVGQAVPPSSSASLDAACSPVVELLKELPNRNVELRIAIAPPRCQVDPGRQDQCASKCGASGSECAAVCKLQSELYGRCSLPGVSVAVSSDAEDIIRLARALEHHLPQLLYAQMALGKRLAEDGRVLVSVGARLPSDLRGAGPRGLACIALGATTVGKSLGHMDKVVAASLNLTARLDPEIHAWEEATR